MKLTKFALITALGTTAIVPAAPANALFGFTCIPRIQNCWCTYLRPCPVIDFEANATARSIKNTLETEFSEKKKSTELLKKQALSQGADLGGLLPGFNSIGFDLDGMLQSQIDQITGSMEGIAGQLQNLNLSAYDLNGMLSGSINTSGLMTSIKDAGLNAFDLKQLGLSSDSINGLLNGNLTSSQMLETAGALGFQGELLNQIGLTPDAISSVVDGKLSLQDLDKNIQASSGLSLSSLGQTGIDIGSLQSLAGSKDKLSSMALIGQLGVGNLSSMSNISQFQGIISGNIDPSQVFSIAGSMGFNTSDLSKLGVTNETLKAFKDGSFSAGQLLEVTNAMGMSGEALNAFGFDSQTLMNLASGKTSPETILKLAQKYGISTSDLARTGLDLDSIISVSQSGNIGEALKLIERSGVGKNPLSGIGISAEQLAGVIDGSISPQQIGAILQSKGIDPSSIILPTADGFGVNGLGQAVDSLQSTFNIPVDSVSGLREALTQAAGFQGKIPSLSAAELLSHLSSTAGIDLSSQEFMNKLVSGEIRGSELMSLLNTQGLGVDQLKSIGVTADTIKAFNSGNFTADELLNFSRNLGIGGQALESLGIGSSALSDIASGSLSPEDFLGSAQSLGVDLEELKNMGIDATSLETISSNGSIEAALKLAESSAGANASSIQIPVAQGSSLASTSDILGNTNAVPNTIGESCTTQLTLISVQEGPNFFGDDVAQIDMALSQGDPMLYEEAIADGMRLSGYNQSHVIGRSIQVKNILTDALDAIDSFSYEIEAAENRDDDLRVNQAIKTQLLMAQAEVTSLMTFWASTDAAKQVNRTTFTTVPTFPHDSKWEESVKSSAAAKTKAIADPAKKSSQIADNYSDFRYQSEKVQDNYDLMVSSFATQSDIAALQDVIMEHEIMKQHLMMLENLVRYAAGEMFTDEISATNLILEDLKSSAGEYDDQTKWETSYNKSLSIERNALANQSPYGSRKIVAQQERGDPEQTSRPQVRPYSYPSIDGASADDPYYIIRPDNNSGSGGAEGDSAPPPPALAGLFQYYMEAHRRETHFGANRRGVSPDTMSFRVWEELKANATECLTGPIETTIQNIETRPELFDLSPYCSRLIYQGGDAEDYISPNDLGGTDSLLWRSKIDVDQTQLLTGGPEAILAAANDLLTSKETEALQQDVSKFGLPGWSEKIDADIAKLIEITQNTDFLQTLDKSP